MFLHWKFNAVQIRSAVQQGVLEFNFSPRPVPALKMQLCEKSHFFAARSSLVGLGGGSFTHFPTQGTIGNFLGQFLPR